MSKELTPYQATPPGSPIVGQTGTNNINVTNQQGGIVNFNYNFPQQERSGSAEEMMAIQKFSKEYYQLIVTLEDDVFVNNIVTVSTNRALCQRMVPQEIFDRCSSLTDDGIAELMSFPAIICRENTELRGITDPNQMAVYAYIKRVMKVGNNIKIAFHPIAPLFQIKLCEKKNAIFFDLNMDCAVTDLNQCAWPGYLICRGRDNGGYECQINCRVKS